MAGMDGKKNIENGTRNLELGVGEFFEGEKLRVLPYHQEDMEPHTHSFFELAYVTGGSAVQILDGKEGRVHKGDYFIVDYGSVHSYAQSRNFDLINCLFLPEIIDETLQECRCFDEVLRVWLMRYYNQYLGQRAANRIFHDEDGSVLNLLLGTQREYEKKEVGYREVFRCRLLEIMIITMRRIMEEDKKEWRLKQGSDVMNQLLEYLGANYKDRSVLGNFCSKFHYSLQYISRKFRQETGMSVSQYLQKLRIEKSCELLAGSSLQIQEIAHEVGYEDVKFFNQLFKRLLHMSPREYRKMSQI